MKNIVILGSTGSIGTQALDVIRGNKDLKVVGLSTYGNIELLEKQIREFKPKKVAIIREDRAKELKSNIRDLSVDIYSGRDGLLEVAAMEGADIVLNSVVGIAGLMPTIEAIRAKKTIALANKETMVTGGEIISKLQKKYGVNIIPVDSEHSAIFQCLKGYNINQVEKIILTASGGPFRGYSLDQLKEVTPERALKHPNWNMGRKITIDSATLMNKGLEVIEARWLFGIEAKNIEVVVHPQSIIHSMVEYIDGSIIAQLGMPDMRIPIQFALTYPERVVSDYPRLDILKYNNLSFEEPDTSIFKCLKLAYKALEAGGTMPVVLNGVNEVAVELFLQGQISFLDIGDIIEKIMSKHIKVNSPTVEDILNTDRWAREETLNFIGR